MYLELGTLYFVLVSPDDFRFARGRPQEEAKYKEQSTKLRNELPKLNATNLDHWRRRIHRLASR